MVGKRIRSHKKKPETIFCTKSIHLRNGNFDLIEYINDLISYERIKRQGVFNPDTVEKLKKQYINENFSINVPFDSDLMIIVITFGIFVEEFQMPNLN